jgi:hypothetical protein
VRHHLARRRDGQEDARKPPDHGGQGDETITLLRVTHPKRAEKLRQAVAAVLAYYMQPDTRVKLRYLSRDVRVQGIWRGWREAGLEHLSDEALTRFCGFPKASVYELAQLMAKDSKMAALCPGRRWWKRTDPCTRPVCDVLDAAVLALRELTTVGHRHQLCSDMGIPTGGITKYLATAKAAHGRGRLNKCCASPRHHIPPPL